MPTHCYRCGARMMDGVCPGCARMIPNIRAILGFSANAEGPQQEKKTDELPPLPSCSSPTG